MKKILCKIFTFIILISIMLQTNYSFASETSDKLGCEGGLYVFGGGGGVESSRLKEKINPIIYVIQLVGSIVSVIALIVIGMKYMLGSIEEKAEYKKTLLPYLIGCIMVFSISNLVSIIYNVAKDLI